MVPSISASVYWSLHCLISTLTQGGSGGHFFGAHLFSLAVGREGCCKQITLVCARSLSATLGLPHSQSMCPPCPHCSGSRLLRREPSQAGPGLHAPPRSKLLRFRHLGSPQRCRLGWACVLCPSQVRAAQVMRCLASEVAATYRLPHPCCLVFWVYNQCTFSGEC